MPKPSRPTGSPRLARRALAATAALLALPLLPGCVATPPASVVEQLDGRTGITVTRLSAPLELVALEARQAGADPFAALAPFETNEMGRRARWLWVAFPPAAGGASPPHAVLVDGQPLSAIAAGSDAQSVGLQALPYAPPAPWTTIRLFALDQVALARLAAARQIAIAVDYPAERVTFAIAPAAPSPLADFAARTADPP